MKRVPVILLAITVLITASVSDSKAQVSVSVNIGAQPMWGPVGYDAVQYYYLPDIECYYYVPRRQFIYMSGPNWVFSYNLPACYRGYDLYSGYKVVCNEPRPYMHYSRDRVAYARYRGWRGRQPVIRDYHGRGGYYVEERHHGNGHGYGHYKEHGHGHGRW